MLKTVNDKHVWQGCISDGGESVTVDLDDLLVQAKTVLERYEHATSKYRYDQTVSNTVTVPFKVFNRLIDTAIDIQHESLPDFATGWNLKRMFYENNGGDPDIRVPAKLLVDMLPGIFNWLDFKSASAMIFDRRDSSLLEAQERKSLPDFLLPITDGVTFRSVKGGEEFTVVAEQDAMYLSLCDTPDYTMARVDIKSATFTNMYDGTLYITVYNDKTFTNQKFPCCKVEQKVGRAHLVFFRDKQKYRVMMSNCTVNSANEYDCCLELQPTQIVYDAPGKNVPGGEGLNFKPEVIIRTKYRSAEEVALASTFKVAKSYTTPESRRNGKLKEFKERRESSRMSASHPNLANEPGFIPISSETGRCSHKKPHCELVEGNDK